MNQTTLFTSSPLLPMVPRVIQAARASQWKVVEYGGGSLHDLRGDGPIAMYGDWRVMCAAANALGVSLLAPTATWQCELSAEYLAREVKLVDWSEARRLTSAWFIKPIDWKSHKAQVYQSGNELDDDPSIPSTARAMISQPVRFTHEFRCFVADGCVRTLSPYFIDGESCHERGTWVAPESMFSDAEAFANRLLRDPGIPAPAAFTLDVGLIEGVGWAVVEAQPCWFSDLYGCDPFEVLNVLRRASPRQSLVTNHDFDWIVRGSGLAAG